MPTLHRIAELFNPRYLLIAAIFYLLAGCAFVTQVSVTPNAGVEPDGDSYDPVLSHNGRYVAFASDATNLVAGDDNTYKDIFVRDNVDGTTALVSKSLFGGPGNNLSGQPDLSADGRYVVYWSFADDIVASDTNLASDVFLLDRQTDVTERVSVDSDENEATGSSLGGSVSDDGRYVVFYTTAALASNDTNGSFDIYKRDRQLGTTTLVSENLSGNAAGSSFDPVISRDGLSVIFWSSATDIWPNDNNGYSDVFASTLISSGLVNLTAGGNGDAYTGDVASGSIPSVVYSSTADNLVAGDTNGVSDIFLLEWTGSSYVRRRLTDGDGWSANPVIAGGSTPTASTSVAFVSAATDLQEPGAAPLDTNSVADVYLWERNPTLPFAGRTRLMSQDFIGGLANASSSRRPAVSPDGSAAAYATRATNIVTSDTNGYEDIFVRPTWVPTITGVAGTLEAGETSVLVITGKFDPTGTQDQVLLAGDGVVSINVDVIGFSSITITVELAPNATTGPRNLLVLQPAPNLGMQGALGSADMISVNVNP